MILVYVMLIAALAVERRVNEISVLHSRGAGRMQVLASFALEWLILAAVAALVGPYLGVAIGRLVANVQGFLEFSAANDAASQAAATVTGARQLPVVVTEQSRSFALLATVVAVAGRGSSGDCQLAILGGHPAPGAGARYAALVLAPATSST